MRIKLKSDYNNGEKCAGENPIFIEIGKSDGNEAHWPTKRGTEERVVQLHWHPLAHDSPKDIRWRRRVGIELAKLLSLPDVDKHVLKTWPTGYQLFEKPRDVDADARSDVELFGFTLSFRSPHACIRHMYALYTSEECPCCRHLSSSRLGSPAIAAGSSSVDDVLYPGWTIRKRNSEKNAPPAPPMYGWGELVWVSLSDSLLRQSTKPIKFWPAIVLTPKPPDDFRVCIPHFPGAIRVTDDVVLPFRAGDGLQFAHTPAVEDEAVDLKSGKYLWFEDAQKFQAALLVVLRASFHGGGVFTNNRDEDNDERGLWFGPEKVLPGHVLRLNVKRKDLNVPRSLSSHEDENADSVVFFQVESVVTDRCDGPVPCLAGDIYELVDSDTTPPLQHLPEAPIGYKFQRILPETYECLIPHNCILGRYRHHLLEHPLLRDRSLGQLGSIAALEGLTFPGQDSNYSVFHHGNLSRSEMLLEAATHAQEMLPSGSGE
ncbi:hypothetical protein BDZ89DRAFT_1163510 [Hymenopellis radicata]|nr:hypothetical protein BDZ89DRAFT_1163510 [Hymenopellis radicata]